MDLDTGETIAGVDTVVDHDESTTFVTQPLTVRRHYNITVHASNSAGSATSYATTSEHYNKYVLEDLLLTQEQLNQFVLALASCRNSKHGLIITSINFSCMHDRDL